MRGALVLAGIWGGVATVLPSMKRLLDKYTPQRASNTVADQDFLRERLCPYLNASCLGQDRCFNADGVVRWPVPAPAGDDHMGINVFAAEEGLQAERFKAFICENLGEMTRSSAPSASNPAFKVTTGGRRCSRKPMEKVLAAEGPDF